VNGRRWTAEHTATLKRMAAAGYSDGEIARHLGFAAVTVFYRRTHLGIGASRRLRGRPLLDCVFNPAFDSLEDCKPAALYQR